MKIIDTSIEAVKVVDSEPFRDHRGSFMRAFCKRELAPILAGRDIAQINHSRTEAVGAVRGLHFQYMPDAEMKLVRCVRGRIFDVAVDLRRGSPTFLQWHGEELSAENARMLVVPEGFAHGFQVLEPGSELFYASTAFYNKDNEAGLRCDDPALGITWPLPVEGLSARDMQHALIGSDYQGIA